MKTMKTMSTSFPSPISLLFAVLTLTALAPGQGLRLGYDGEFPSAAGKAAVMELDGQSFEDKLGRLGGGTWSIHVNMGSPMYSRGPAQAEMIEARSRITKGPSVVFEQGKRCYNIPCETDGDVGEVWQLVRDRAHPSIKGEQSRNAKWTWALTRSFGDAACGLRAGIAPMGADPARCQCVVYNATDARVDVRGALRVEVDGKALPIELRWPPQAEVTVGESRFVLEPGQSVERSFDLSQLAADAKLAGLFDKGEHTVQVVFEPSKKAEETAATESLRSRLVTLTVEGVETRAAAPTPRN